MAILSCHVSIKLPPKISDGQRNVGTSFYKAPRLLHMKGKRNRHFGPDKVAVLHEWFSESVTGLLSTIGRIAALAVSSRSSRRSYCVREVGDAYAGRAQRGCPVTQDDQSAPPAICTMRWRFTGAHTKRSGGGPQLSPTNSSEQILVVVMDASPGFCRRGTGLFILWPVLFVLEGLAAQDHRWSVMVDLSHLELLHGVGRGGNRHDDTPVTEVMGVNVLQLLHKFRQHGGHRGTPL